MKPTPFDELALLYYNHDQDGKVGRDSLQKIINFSVELRLRYMELVECAELIKISIERMHDSANQGSHEMTKEELLIQQYENKRPVIAYQDFMSALNTHGRVLETIGILIPEYYRIRFYRNLLVEHWDDYLDKSCNEVSGWTARVGKIVVPYHSSKANRPSEGQPLWERIKIAFSEKGVQVPFTQEDTISYEKYTEFTWKLLEQIDPKLNTSPRYRIIPDTLVELLYDYAMPVPILDVESYCSSLRDILVIEVNKILHPES